MVDTETSARPSLVLVANDHEWSLRSLESILAPSGYGVILAYTGRQALAMARSARPDAVIVDYKMPDLDGLEVCRALHADPAFEHAPIILTTAGTITRAERVAAHAAGAWEFCTQPLDGEVFLLRLGHYVRVKRELDRLAAESLLDPLTGLYNMRGLSRRAREIGADACRRRAPVACIALAPTADGSDARPDGDAAPAPLLAHVARVWRRAARASDALGRLGRLGRGEFAIIAPDTDAVGGRRLIQRLDGALATQPFGDGGTPQALRLRAGYCAAANLADAGVDVVELLVRASTALQHAGRDDASRIRSFDQAAVAAAG